MVRCAKGSRSHLERQAVTEPDLIRFVTAQADIYDQVLKELTEGM